MDKLDNKEKEKDKDKDKESNKEGREGKEKKKLWQKKRKGTERVSDEEKARASSIALLSVPARPADIALLTAAECGSVDQILALVEAHRGEQGYVNGVDKLGMTALHLAAMGSHIECCDLLIKEGADPRVPNNEGTTPLHYLVRKAPKEQTVTDNTFLSPIPLASLLAQPPKPASPYIRLLDTFLLKGVNLDAQSSRGETPLHQAAVRQNAEAVRWLIENGATPTIKNKMGESPLDYVKEFDTPTSESLVMYCISNNVKEKDNTVTNANTLETSILPSVRSILSWGYGPYGQLGYQIPQGGDRSQATPKEIEVLKGKRISSVVCGSYVSAALLENGQVFIWGRGKAPPSLNLNCLLLGNGNPSDQPTPQLLQNLPPVVNISLGVYHSAVVAKDGYVYTWGHGGNGQLGNNTKESVNLPTRVEELANKKINIVQVVCGETHTIALSDDGKVYVWGESEHGQLGLGDTIERLIPTRNFSLDSVKIVQISCSATHSACVSSDGQVYTFGTIGNLTPQLSPVLINTLDGVFIRQVACGGNVVAVLSELGDVYTWGTGKHLGHDTPSENFPRLVEALKDRSIRQISCGTSHMVAVTDGGCITTWGKQTFGQCGTGSRTDHPIPTRVFAQNRVVHVACGENHTAVVIDSSTSILDDAAWKLLEYQRSFLRALNTIYSVYYFPLTRARSGEVPQSPKIINSRHPFFSSSTYVLEDDLNTIFSTPFDHLIKENSQFLNLLDRGLGVVSFKREKLWSIFGSNENLKYLASEGISDNESSGIENALSTISLSNGFSKTKRGSDGTSSTDSNSKLTPFLTWHFGNDSFIQYFKNLPRSLASIEAVGRANPQFFNNLTEARKVADLMRKSGVSIESDKDMDLKSLLLEPFFMITRVHSLWQNLLESIPEGCVEYSDIEDTLDNLEKFLHEYKQIILDGEDASMNVSGSGQISSLTRGIENVQEFKRLCKKAVKTSRKMALEQKTVVDERDILAENIIKTKKTLETDAKKGSDAPAASLDAFGDVLRKISSLDSQHGSRLANQFCNPIGQLVQDLDEGLADFASLKRSMEEHYHDYATMMGKIVQNKNMRPELKKLSEKEIQVKKKQFEEDAAQIAIRLRFVNQKKEKALYYYHAAMKAQYEYFTMGLERMQQFKPNMDALEAYLKTQDRREWAAQLHLIISHELANLSADHSSDNDSQLVIFLLDLPPITASMVASSHGTNYEPLVDLLSSPSLAVLNAIVVTTANSEEQEAVLRVGVRILDAYHKTLPIIKYGIVKEVEATSEAPTLFRSNSIATKLMGMFIKLTGLPYLQKIIKPQILEMLKGGDYEVDPKKAKEGDNLDQNMERVLNAAQLIFNRIYSSVNEIPLPMRVIGAFLANEVIKKFPHNKHTAVGGYIFLRFICPAILSPGSFGIMDENPSTDAGRPLVIISKVLQNLSNGVEFGAKEYYMLSANRFTSQNSEKVKIFFDELIDLPFKIDNITGSEVDYPPLATLEEVLQSDLRIFHTAIIRNLPKIVKNLSLYKQKDTIARLASILADLGDPTLLYK